MQGRNVEVSWSSSIKKFDVDVIKKVYENDIKRLVHTKIQKLDQLGYLEQYLWTHFPTPSSGKDDVGHILSILALFNEKFNESPSVALQLLFSSDEANNNSKFDLLFTKTIELVHSELSMEQKYVHISFFINILHRMEYPQVRENILKYFSLSIWENLSAYRLKEELAATPQLMKLWDQIQSQKVSEDVPVEENKSAKGRKRKTPPTSSTAKNISTIVNTSPEVTWIFQLLTQFLHQIESNNVASVNTMEILYLQRFLEFLIDLLSQLSTRRFLNTLIDDMHVVLRCKRSEYYTSSNHVQFQRLVDLLEVNTLLEVNDQTGKAMSPTEVVSTHSTRVQQLQSLAFTDFQPKLRDLVFASLGQVSRHDFLQKQFLMLKTSELSRLTIQLGYITEAVLKQLETSIRNRLNTEPSMDTEIDDVVEQETVAFLQQLLFSKLVRRSTQLEEVNKLSLYPNETLLWDEQLVPRNQSYTGGHPCAIPKLNIQFLSMHDYLLRNFTLFRLESAFEIREDIVDAIKRMGPRQALKLEASTSSVTFAGWARMALPLSSLSIDEVSEPRVGEIVPSKVTATLEVDLTRFVGDIRREWESLREHDVLFLVSIVKPSAEVGTSSAEFEHERAAMSKGRKPTGSKDFQWREEDLDFPQRFGVHFVRGGEVFEVRDEDDVPLNDPTKPDERNERRGHKRRIRIRLDPAQYYADVQAGRADLVYDSFNLLIRRKPEENNFRAVLETVRDLLNAPQVSLGAALPAWLQDLILGYGNPASASYRNLNKGASEEFIFGDTFLDFAHVVESFPSAQVQYQTASGDVVPINRSVNTSEVINTAIPTTTTTPASVQPKPKGKGRGKKAAVVEEEVEAVPVKSTQAPTSSSISSVPQSSSLSSLPSMSPPYRLKLTKSSNGSEIVTVSGITTENPGPFPEDASLTNSVRSTPSQIEAIRSGMNLGLTMIVGPPGTGKTDVAVQIIANLYKNFPTQKILLVTHSNSALNDLFEKIMQRDVDPRHLLRLGSGESDLRESLALSGAGGSGIGQGEIFSKQGRVNWSLARRMQLLGQVQRLGVSLGTPGDVGYTCETAQYFRIKVQHQIDEFKRRCSNESTTTISDIFPFNNYFSNTPTPLFTNHDRDADLTAAEGALHHLNKMFDELSDYRAFEVLRTQALRTDYLLTKQARIVAMTCTHAAIIRRRLIELDFKYDSVVMEEAAQVLEVETLIPMLLQSPEPMSGSRLKRVVLIGDHYQLPPVVKHAAFQKYASLDQSMFARLIRLGVPAVLLDKQGRARPEIAALYSWRYHQSALTSGLGDLPLVSSLDSVYTRGNAGFAHTFQLVDVPDFQGKGESCPTPFFYQNLGEAEYVVAVYQFMRLLGYPAEKISILTTYNGQKNLIRDVLSQRCRSSVFGQPARVTTVDKYQGQQNDYILLSLVRTEHVGHLRDIRRLIVALSRARLGMYIFCRKSLFENCFELAPAMNLLLQKPSQLQLVVGEEHPCQRLISQTPKQDSVHSVEDVTAMGVLVYRMVEQAAVLSGGMK